MKKEEYLKEIEKQTKADEIFRLGRESRKDKDIKTKKDYLKIHDAVNRKLHTL